MHASAGQFETDVEIDTTTMMEIDRRALRWPVIACAVIILIGAGLRFVQLGHASLWFDEGYTAWVASLTPREILRVVRFDTAPPLYYLMLRGWVDAFGRSETAMRSLSAVCSTGALLAFYPIAVSILKEGRAVVLAVALFAVSEMQVAYAHEARFYALITLLSAINFLLVLGAVEESRPRRYAVMAAMWAVSLYTNNMMIIYLARWALRGWCCRDSDR